MNDKIEWGIRKVIECAGIPIEDATPMIISLARIAYDECYYIDRAAEQLRNILSKRGIHY